MRTSSPRRPLTAHERADQKLERLRLRRARADNPKAHPLVIRDQINGWLDYRNQHESGAPRARL
jgi:hypothetical protein